MGSDFNVEGCFVFLRLVNPNFLKGGEHVEAKISRSSPKVLYPEPIGVLTATGLFFRREKVTELLMVELTTDQWVLPGGIFNVGLGTHRSQRDVIGFELFEETGLRFKPNSVPVHIAISQRLDVDPRVWCSTKTINGANDYIMTGVVEGELKPRDTAEVKRAFFMDVNKIPLEQVSRGHDLLIRFWQVICARKMLSAKNRWTKENIQAIEALSNDRHVVSVNRFNFMIYFEDRVAVRDSRV